MLTFWHDPPLPGPVCDVTDKVKEEVTLRNTDHLVPHLDEQTETLGRFHL